MEREDKMTCCPGKWMKNHVPFCYNFSRGELFSDI